MANHRNRVWFDCCECSKHFWIIKCRENKSKRHFCSAHCRSIACGRDKRLYKYPKVVGVCKQCGGNIIAKDMSFDKPNRLFCSKSCRSTYNNLHNNPAKRPEVARKISESKKGVDISHLHTKEAREKMIKTISGSGHWNWQGGITPKAQKERNNYKFKQWRYGVFGKDNFTCRMCGKRSTYIQAHHILPWSKFPKFRYDVNNGVVLCKNCHLSIKNKEWFYAPKFLGI
jgi:5-methylcytosine-specific restriction endonuclease McrA